MSSWRRQPALEGATAEGTSVALPEAGLPGQSPVERLLSRGRLRATLFMLGPAFVYFAGILSAQFASVAEGLVATSYFWLLLCLIVFGQLTILRLVHRFVETHHVGRIHFC